MSALAPRRSPALGLRSGAEVRRRPAGAERTIATPGVPASRTAWRALLTAFRRRSRDGFTSLVINVARILATRLRETSQPLASRL